MTLNCSRPESMTGNCEGPGYDRKVQPRDDVKVSLAMVLGMTLNCARPGSKTLNCIDSDWVTHRLEYVSKLHRQRLFEKVY